MVDRACPSDNDCVAIHAKRTLVDVAGADVFVTVRGEVIEAVDEKAPSGVEVLELGDADLIPGLIDVHSDSWQARRSPRRGTAVPMDSVLVDLDRHAVAHGVLTHYLCVTYDDDPVRGSLTRAADVLDALDRVHGLLLADHRVHLRVELTSTDFESARAAAGSSGVGLVSYMNHAPNVGQYAEMPDKIVHDVLAADFHGSSAQQVALMAERAQRATSISTRREIVAEISAVSGKLLASHDDATEADVEVARRLGVRISEFPLSARVAEAAAEHDLGVIMGAPNAWRGASHLKGPSARELLAAGSLTALASDYHLPSLLAAPYALVRDKVCPWSDAVNLVTRAPADLLGLTDRGRIAPGLRADLVAVSTTSAGLPVVQAVWARGRLAFRGHAVGKGRSW